MSQVYQMTLLPSLFLLHMPTHMCKHTVTLLQNPPEKKRKHAGVTFVLYTIVTIKTWLV